MSDRSDPSPVPNAPPSGGAFFFAVQWAALLVLCGLVYALYAPGLGFGLAFDDVANLTGLATVHDYASALLFVFAGDAGPLGRPVSLATFLLQASAWPEHVDAMVRFNILLHLFNALLVALLGRRLARFLPGVQAQPPGFGIAVAALWVSSPLLMSTSLMAVQRMTSLSACFCLLGMIGWLRAREQLAERAGPALVGMSAAVLAGTALAALSKETGALLPLFIMVVEFTLVGPMLPPRLAVTGERLAWRCWCGVVFGVPLLGIAYLAWLHLAHMESAYAGFGYGPMERLLTEAGLLFGYLRQMVLPLRSGLGPFHDDVLIAPGIQNAVAVLPLLGWALLCLAAWVLRAGRFRAFSFALAWFLTGHLLESTIFPLEASFEHRNYLPAAGVWVGVCALLWSGIGPVRRAGVVLMVALLLNNLFVLRETGLVWSDPVLAGRVWYAEHPDSMRALLQYGRSLGERGSIDESVRIYEAASPRLQATPHYRAGRLQLYCATRPPASVAEAASDLAAGLGGGRIDYHVPESIGLVMQLAATGRCKGFDIDRGRAMLEAIVSSTDARVMPRARRSAHAALADYWIGQRELDPTLRHLEQVWAMSGDIGALRQIVRVLVSAGLCTDARSRLQEVSALEPLSPLHRLAWRQQRDGIAGDIGRGCADPVGGVEP